MSRKTFLSFFFLFFVVSSCSLFGGETAFTAINVLRQSGRTGLVDHIAQMKGGHGDPEPNQWYFVCIDPKARAGVREVTIEGEDIVEEKAPSTVNASVGSMVPLNLERLKIDTSTLFDIADAEANKAKIGFDFLNYRLFTDSNTGAPMWEVKLYRKPQRETSETVYQGTFYCSGESGAVVQPLPIKS